MVKQINIVGSIFGSSGYDSHTRNLANAINKIIPVRLTCPVTPDWNTKVNDEELLMLKRPEIKDELNLIITMPQFWKNYLNNKRNFVYFIWEGDRVPTAFLEECINPRIERIIVPSQHTYNALIQTALAESSESRDLYLTRKTVIIPHGVSPDFFIKREEIKRPLTFLANKGFRTLYDRGGIQYLIRAYMEEFTKEDNVELIIKINPAYGINMPLINQVVSQYLKPNSPVIRFIVNEFNPKGLINFYKLGDVFVSPTRSEAFNLPCLEAMASGIPCIVTNFGGQTDYIDEINGWLIPFKLEEVKNEIMYEGTQWATPDINELRATMRFCYNNPFGIKTKGINAQRTAERYLWSETAQKIVNLIN